MTRNTKIVNFEQSVQPTITAPIKNVMLCTRLMQEAIDRPPHLPNIVSFYGNSGLGKSVAAAFVANKFRAAYVECKSVWTKRKLLSAIATELGITPGKSAADMLDQICEELALSGTPLIIDEMDHIVNKKFVEVIRDIADGSNAPVLLIGEEQLSRKLQKWERFHNRMLAWQPAQPADIKDAQQLVQMYCEINIEDKLLQKVIADSQGVTRRICVNLNMIQNEAYSRGQDSMSLAEWGEKPLYTGNAPLRRPSK
jgi:DNA transposition AAA+ family ATPase